MKFKNQFFFPILKFLKNNCCVKKIDAFYTEPATYKFPKKRESRGYFPNVQEDTKVLFNYAKAQAGIEIKSIPGFEGGRPKATVLVILLGFDGKVAVRIKEEYNAEKVLLINGFPAYLPKFRDISLINNKEIVSAFILKCASKHSLSNVQSVVRRPKLIMGHIYARKVSKSCLYFKIFIVQ